MTARESRFQADFIKHLKSLYPEAIVLKNDPNYKQGIPDVLFLLGTFWAAFECKRSPSEPFQPNQRYYVGKMNEMSFAAFVYPENEDEVLYGIQCALQAGGQARFPRR